MYYFCKPKMKALLYLFLGTILVACNSEKATEKPVKSTEVNVSIPDYAEAGIYENAVLSIDEDTSLIEVGSLSYINDNTEEKSTKALVDKQFALKRITLHEVYNGKKVETTFYFVKGKLLVSDQKTEIITDTGGSKTEIRTYYDDSKRPVFSAKRSAPLEKNIEKSTYKTIQKIAHDDAMALDIINQQGAFRTGFLGFLESGPRTFLIVGTEMFNASLMIGEMTPLIKKLKMNEKAYLNKTLKVQFQDVTEPNGFSYHGLNAVELQP